MNDRAAFATRGGDTADLLEMRHAVRSGNHSRVAEMRAEGRGACCEFHAGFETRVAHAAPAAPAASHVMTDAELLQFAIEFYATEGM